MPGFYISFSIIVVIAAGVAVYFIIRAAVRKRIASSLSTTLFLVKIPKPSTGSAAQGAAGAAEHGDLKAELAHFEQLLGSLAAIKKPFTFELAVPHLGEEIHFYLAVPKLSQEIAAKQIQGLWSGASVEPVADDFNIFNLNGVTAAGYVMQKEHYALPIQTLRGARH